MAVNISLLNSSSTNNINTNFERVATALADTVGRSGSTPNQMNADLDMNSNDLLNVKTLQVQDLTIDGDDPTGILERALDAVELAEASATAAATSAAAAATFDPSQFYTKGQVDTLNTSFWDNETVIKTAAYTIIDADHAKTIIVGGGTFYDVTVDGTGSYRTNFFVRIANSHQRGTRILVNGMNPFILWPKQTVIIFNTSGSWTVDNKDKKFKLNEDVLIGTFYVDPLSGTAGVNNTDGLSAAGGPGAFKYIQDAINNIVRNIDSNVNLVKIKVLNSVMGEQIQSSFAGQPLGTCQILIEGGTGAAPIRWVATANNQTFVQARDNGILTLDGFDFDAGSFTGCCFLNPSQMGVIDFKNCWFGACTGGIHMSVGAGGFLNNLDDGSGNNYKIYGNMTYHILFAGPYHMAMGGVTIQMPNGLSFTAFIKCVGPGLVNWSFNAFSGPGAGAGSVGNLYELSGNAVISLSGTTLPGNAAGTTASGGQVI